MRTIISYVVVLVLLCGSVVAHAAPDAARVAGDLKVDGIHFSADNNVIRKLADLSSPWTISNTDIYFTGGNVGIGTLTPTTALDVSGNTSVSGNLSFGTATRQMLNLFGTAYGLGVQDYTLYSRTDGNGGFAWYKGGTHSNTANDPGTGGTVLMTLDASGNLNATGFSGDGSGLTAIQTSSIYGMRNMKPCTWNGTQVDCSGTCSWSSVNGDVSCSPGTTANCTAVAVGGGFACPSSGPCSLSCADGLTPKAGWTFAESSSGTRLIQIPTSSTEATGLLTVHLRHPQLVCTPSSTPYSVPITMYLYKGGAVEPNLVLWRGTLSTMGGPLNTRGYIPEFPVINADVPVTPGANYSIWLSAGPLSSPQEYCYWARSTSDTANDLVIHFTPVKPGL